MLRTVRYLREFQVLSTVVHVTTDEDIGSTATAGIRFLLDGVEREFIELLGPDGMLAESTGIDYEDGPNRQAIASADRAGIDIRQILALNVQSILQRDPKLRRAVALTFQ